MDLTSSVVIASVCKYTSKLFGVSKSITSSMIHHADTFHIEGTYEYGVSIFAHRRFQRGRHIDSSVESKYKFTKVRTLVIHPSISGGQLKNILVRFPLITHIVFKKTPVNGLRNIPDTVTRIDGLIDRERNFGPFPKSLSELTLSISSRIDMKLLPKSIDLHLLYVEKNRPRRPPAPGIRCSSLPKNTVSLQIRALNGDLSRSRITSLVCNNIDDVSFIPLKLTSLTYNGDMFIDLSKFTSLEFLRCSTIDEYTVPESLRSLTYLGVRSLDLSSTMIRSLVVHVIDRKWKMPYTLKSLNCGLLSDVPEMHNLQSLTIERTHNSIRLDLLPKTLMFLSTRLCLTLSTAYKLPKGLYELHVKAIKCTRIPLPNLKYLRVLYPTDQLSVLKIIDGSEFDLENKNCIISLIEKCQIVRENVGNPFV